MSHSTPEKTIAPKRQRMLDMVLALGGLKEEAVIPLSKVKEELENLKVELTPLTESILAFPDSYFGEFLEAFQKANLISEINDKGILQEAISNLEESQSISESEALKGLLTLLSDTLSRMTVVEEKQVSSDVDMDTVLSTVLELTSEIETSTTQLEQNAETEAESAKKELATLIQALDEAVTKIEVDPEEALDELQKIGTKTRYGPGLRATAQVKRGKRDDRIDETRFSRLVSENILTEMYRGLIMFILGKMGSKTIIQMSEILSISPQILQNVIVTMIQRGEVEMVSLDGDAPVFSMVLKETPNSTIVLKRIVQQVRGMTKSLEGDEADVAGSALERLQKMLERLQILGTYDETALSDNLNKLRESVDSATEAILSTQTSDDSENLRLLVSAGLEAFARFRLKITLEKGPNLVSGLNVYGEKLDPEVYQTMMDTYLENELERGTILILIRELGAMAVKDLAERTTIPPDRILRHLLRMKRDELLTIAGESHGYILYDVPRTPTETELTVQTACSLSLQLTKAKVELERILGDFKAQDIGKLASSLETFAKARDKLATIKVSGTVIDEDSLVEVEDKIRSGVLLAYRTRAKIPSTRPKVTLADLADVDVPSVLDEYKSQMGYAPLLGFGTVDWDHSKCIGCKSCEISCPEDAIVLKPRIELPKFFDMSEEQMSELPSNRSLFYKTVQNLATTRPSKDIVLEKESPGFGSVEVDLWLCVACRTCVRRCPGPEGGALELILKWNLPEVVRHITTSS